ncbi:hypothetical protein HW132_31975 [Brasilonema sp. CT11]|nr:hypothetical protein [Brasilonema sp. CT11]
MIAQKRQINNPNGIANLKNAASDILESKQIQAISSRYDTIQFQMYDGTNSREQSKDDVSRISNALRSKASDNQDKWDNGTRYQFPIYTGINALIAALDSGIAVHFGITHKSTKSEDVEYFDGGFTDYDATIKIGDDKALADNAATIEELLTLPTIKQYTAFYQSSYSGGSNYHFHGFYNRRCSSDEHKTLQAVWITKLNSELAELGDRKTFDPSTSPNSTHVCYAGKTDCQFIDRVPGLDNDYGDLIPVDEWLKIGADLGLTKSEKFDKAALSKNVKKRETIEESHLEYIHRVIVEDKLQGDFTALFNLYDHQWHRPEPWDGGGIKVKGSNPFSSTNKTGTSFYITYYPDKLPMLPPVWCSANGTGDPEHKKPGEDITGYFYYMARLEGKYQHGGLEGNRKKIVDEICNHFEVEPYPWNKKSSDDSEKKLAQIVEDVRETFKDEIFSVGEDEYFFYLRKESRWLHGKGRKYVFGLIFSDYIKEKYGIPMSENAKLRDKILSIFNNGNTLTSIPDEKPTWLVLANGTIVNAMSKEVKTGKNDVFNRSVYPWCYSEMKQSPDDSITRVKNCIRRLTQSEAMTELLLVWMQLNALGQAWRTQSILGIIGASGKGKTSYLMMIKALINGVTNNDDYRAKLPNSKGYASTLDADNLTSNNSHSTQILEGIRNVLIPELRGEVSGKSLSIFKATSGNLGQRTIEINPKGLKAYTTQFFGSITFDAENMPKIPSDVKGYFRRFVMVEIHESASTDKEFWKEFFDWYNTEVVLSELFNYFLTLDVESLVNRFYELAASKEINEVIKGVRRQNSPLADFVADRLVITNNESSIPASFLYDDHVMQCEKNRGYGFTYSSKQKFGKALKDVLKDLFDWKGESKDKKVSGKCMQCYTGIRFKTQDELDRIDL